MNRGLNTAFADKLTAVPVRQVIAQTEIRAPQAAPKPYEHPLCDHRNDRPDRNDARSISTNVDEDTWRKAEELRNLFNIAISPMIRNAVKEVIHRRWDREMKAGKAA
jgi:hypothetical protein